MNSQTIKIHQLKCTIQWFYLFLKISKGEVSSYYKKKEAESQKKTNGLSNLVLSYFQNILDVHTRNRGLGPAEAPSGCLRQKGGFP